MKKVNTSAILGTGQLGLAVLEMLLHSDPGGEILLVNRKGILKNSIPPNVKLVAADVTNAKEMEDVFLKVDVVYSCTDVPYQMWEAFYPATATALAYAVRKTNARLVFADNLYSYGNVSGQEMNENLSHSAKTKKGIIRASVINILLNPESEFKSRVAIVKAADFIGPRIYKGIFGTDFLDKLYNNKRVTLFGKPSLPHAFTYIKDFAAAMINVGNATDTFGQVWHVPNAPAISLNKWVQLFEAETDRKAKVIVLPKFVVWVVGLFNSLVHEFYELSYQFENPYLVNHTKYANHFGAHFTSPELIVKETIQWYNSFQSVK